MSILRRNRGNRQDVENLFSIAEKLMDEPLWKRPSGESEFTAPSLDLSESDSDYLIELEVPGLEPDDMEITLSDRTLTIKGEKQQEKDEEAREYHRIERRFGSFTRQVHLPEVASEEEIEAEYERGVLRITIPKTTESATKRIDVNVKEK